MFVKIVSTRTRATKTMACTQVTVLPEVEKTTVSYTYAGKDFIEICKTGEHIIFLLNSDGKTIDTYRL